VAPRRKHGASGRLHDLVPHPSLAGRRLDEAGDQAERRGLAAAGRSEQRHELTRLHIQRHILEREHGPAAVRQAVEEALELGCSDVGAVRYLLSVAGLGPQAPVAPVHLGALNRYDRPQPRLEDYDRLRPNWVEVIQ